MANFNILEYTEECQKNLHDTVTQYVRTENPVYTAIALQKISAAEQIESIYRNPLRFDRWLLHLRSLHLAAVVYEEYAGIHIIWIDSMNKPLAYRCFIPFADIKKIYLQVPFNIFSDTVIKTHSKKKYIFRVSEENVMLSIRDRFGNSGYLAFLDKLREFAMTLK